MKLIVTWCVLLSIGILFSPRSHAQTLPFDLTGGSGSTAVDFELRLDGSILEKGSGTSTMTNADIQTNPVFLWYAPQAALRAVTGSTETTSTIGANSVAFGYDCTASGLQSFAVGSVSTAGGSTAVALGYSNYAAYNSVAVGTADSSTAAWSCTLGGYGNTASNSFATAMGGATVASGVGATSTGYVSVASGEFSATFNYGTIAQAFDSAAFGTYNVGGGNATSWVATDPLFEIGNGTSSSATADAFIVYKNGSAKFQGPVTVPQSGDIPMYTGN